MPFVSNPTVAAQMDQVVQILVNSNKSGAARTAHGGVSRPYVPVTGLEAVPCHPCFKRAGEKDMDGRLIDVEWWRFLFAIPITIDRSNQIVWIDANHSGITRYFDVLGPSRAPGGNLCPGGQPWYWAADAVEWFDSMPT